MNIEKGVIKSRRSRLHLGLIWTLCISCACVAGVMLDAQYLVMGTACAVVFFSVYFLIPGIRRAEHEWLGPAGIVLAYYALILVISPAVIIGTGVSQLALPYIPSDLAMNIAMAINCCAFLSYAVGFHLYNRHHNPQGAQAKVIPAPQERNRISKWRPGPKTSAVFILAGILGINLYYGNISNYLAFLGDPQLRLAYTYDSSPLEAVIGNLLLPFLPFGIISLWCFWLDRNGSRASAGRLLVTTLSFMFLMFLAGLQYSRTGMVLPIIITLSVLSLKMRRISAVLVSFVVATIFAAVLLLGSYRQSSFTVEEVMTVPEARVTILGETNWSDTIQTFFGGPQVIGFLLEETNFASRLYWGETLVGSVMDPLPIIGKGFRGLSGVTVLNDRIYGPKSGIRDQIIPFRGELMLNFHIVGVIGGFALVGLLVGMIERKIKASIYGHSIMLYCYMWIAFGVAGLVLGSLANTIQYFIYTGWPVYTVGILRVVTGRIEKRM